MTENYRNAFTEVNTILAYLDDEEYKKIPSELIDVISLNRNKGYFYEVNSNIALKEQQMLPETKAILFNLFRDYLATSKQKIKIIQYQIKERENNSKKLNYN